MEKTHYFIRFPAFEKPGVGFEFGINLLARQMHWKTDS